jgi:hypothetical protein
MCNGQPGNQNNYQNPVSPVHQILLRPSDIFCHQDAEEKQSNAQRAARSFCLRLSGEPAALTCEHKEGYLMSNAQVERALSYLLAAKIIGAQDPNVLVSKGRFSQRLFY